MAMDAASAMGSIALWGFSPAIDFSVDSSNQGAFEFWNKESNEAVSILFVGVPDLSHILQNLPEALRRTDRPADFYILENSVEVYARQLLLLWLLCEPPDRVGLQEKVWTFLEIVGNTLVRPSTARYVAETAVSLIELVTSGEDCASLPLVSLAGLRHRERDQLAAVFQFWRSGDSKIDVAHMWDLRLRQQLAQRYDARRGVFDWDYFMRLKDRLDVEFIRPEEYKHWRETGVAFRRPGTEQTCVNLTLVTTRALGRPGERQLRRGYWGDTVSGPYASFGLRSDDPSLARKQNGRLTASAATVCAANLEALFSAICASLHTASHVRVRFLPADGGAALSRRAAHRGRFASAVFSSGMSHLLTPSLTACLRGGATVAVETARYVVWVTAEQQRRLLERYGEMADTAGCRPVGGRAAGDRGGGRGEEEAPSPTEEEGKGKSCGTGTEDSGGLSEEKGKMVCTDGDAASKSTEVIPEEVGKPPANFTKDNDQNPEIGENPQPAVETSELVCNVGGKDVNAVEADQKPTIDHLRDGCNDDSIVTHRGDSDDRRSCLENGAGEPEGSRAEAWDCNKNETQSPDAQSEKCHSTEGRQEGAREEMSHQRKEELCAKTVDAIADSASSYSADIERPSGAELGGTRNWASDKLTSLPEWICFVKQ